MFTATRNVTEGAGAAALAAALKERKRIAGRKAALVLSGANVDRNALARILTSK
jgi:threonine dehydratase